MTIDQLIEHLVVARTHIGGEAPVEVHVTDVPAGVETCAPAYSTEVAYVRGGSPLTPQTLVVLGAAP